MSDDITKPDEEYRWAEGDQAQVSEPENERDSGWPFGFTPPSEQMNWLQRMVGRWIEWFEHFTETHVHDGGDDPESVDQIDVEDHVDYGENAEAEVENDTDSVYRLGLKHLGTGDAEWASDVLEARDGELRFGPTLGAAGIVDSDKSEVTDTGDSHLIEAMVAESVDGHHGFGIRRGILGPVCAFLFDEDADELRIEHRGLDWDDERDLTLVLDALSAGDIDAAKVEADDIDAGDIDADKVEADRVETALDVALTDDGLQTRRINSEASEPVVFRGLPGSAWDGNEAPAQGRNTPKAWCRFRVSDFPDDGDGGFDPIQPTDDEAYNVDEIRYFEDGRFDVVLDDNPAPPSTVTKTVQITAQEASDKLAIGTYTGDGGASDLVPVSVFDENGSLYGDPDEDVALHVHVVVYWYDNDLE